ncbi:MAG: aminotransferase class V-fold PLP-dependent enzyme [Bradymonadia bacterium]
MTGDSGRQRRRKHWTLDPKVTFLNHGSFGACPTVVRDKQRQLQDALEREPVAFFLEAYPELLAQTKQHLASFLGTSVEGLALVRNTTEGVNAILSSIDWQPDDEILVTDHTYPACHKIALYMARRTGLRVRVFAIEPDWTTDEILDAFRRQLTSKTRLALMDHVTSATGMVLPADGFVAACRNARVLSLIDGAHAPGMLDLNLGRLEPDFYVGNLHKWCCAPKGSAFVYAASAFRPTLRPTSISHGFDEQQTNQDMAALFDWPGTFDPTAWLSVPTALDFVSNLHPDGIASLRAETVNLRQRADTMISRYLPPLAAHGGDSWMRTFRLPDAIGAKVGALEIDSFQKALNQRYSIQVPVTYWPAYPHRVLRISVAPYNTMSDYDTLCQALDELLREGRC